LHQRFANLEIAEFKQVNQWGWCLHNSSQSNKIRYKRPLKGWDLVMDKAAKKLVARVEPLQTTHKLQQQPQ